MASLIKPADARAVAGMTDEQLAAAEAEKSRRDAARQKAWKEEHYYAPRQKAQEEIITKLQGRYPGLSEEDLEDIWAELDTFHERWDR